MMRTLAPRARALLAIALLGLLSSGCAGCGSDGSGSDAAPTPNSAAPATGAAAPASATVDPSAAKQAGTADASRFSASLDGAPMPLRSALVRSYGGRALALVLSTAPLTCADLSQPRAFGGESTANLIIAPKLDRDGSESWRITSAVFEGTTRRGDLGKVTLSREDATEALELTLKLDFVSAAIPGRQTASHKLVLDGTLVAAGCGVVPINDLVPARPQTDLVASIADRKFAIGGATITRTSDTLVLNLSTQPHSCVTSLGGSDASFSLTLKGDPLVIERVLVAGHVLGNELRGKPAADALKLNLANSAKNSREVEATLQGALTLGGYDIVLEGTANARTCG